MSVKQDEKRLPSRKSITAKGISENVVEGAKPNPGKVKIIKKLGEGGNGVVYLIEKNGKQYAMKVVKKSSSRLEAAKKEFDIVKELEEERGCERGIICYDSLSYDNHNIYLIMEYLKGHDLYGVLKRRKLTSSQIMTVYNHLAKVLCEMHSLGVVHRDLKLENIVFTDQKLTMIDFGSACEICVDTSPAGYWTEAYAAPEVKYKEGVYQQLSSPERKRLSTEKKKKLLQPSRTEWKRRDVWALGIVFYELASGSPISSQSDIDLGLIKNRNIRNIIKSILIADPDKRPTACEVYNMVKTQITKVANH